MGDVDAGNVKAKASIEYDGSGLKQMKEDLASLSDMVGGGLEQGVGSANDALSGLSGQMASNADSAKSFTSAIGELPKIAESGASTISEMTGVLSEHRSAVEETGVAYESMQKPIESAVSNLEKVAPSMQTATEHTQRLAESMQGMSGAVTENMAVFEDSLVNPYPFQMIDQHLKETGQSWSDFTSSIGGENTSILSDMAKYGQKTYDVVGGMNAQIAATGKTFTESASATDEFTKQFNGLNEAVVSTNKSINEFGGVSKGLYGPELPPGGVGKTVGIGEIFGGASEGMLGMLNDIAMPLMAIQMIGMAVQSVGQAMYDSAAIAEGPAAHSMGTFTGTVDALGQSLQNTGSQFSESFGKQIMPMLNALNMQMSGTGNLAGDTGSFLGGLTTTLSALWQIGTGSNFIGGTETLINQGASVLGLQQPFQGPGPEQQAQIKFQQQMAALPFTVQQNAQQLQYQSSLILAQAVDPNWLAANQQATASQQAAQYLIQDYNIRNPQSQYDLIQNARYNTYAAQQARNYQQAMATGNYQTYGQAIGGDINAGDWGQMFGDLGGGISGYFGEGWAKNAHAFSSIGDFFGSWWDNFWGINNSDGSQRTQPSVMTGGCFIAGTPILLSDGTEKPIEDVRVDDQVLAYDGTKQVPATIIACIMFPAKQTYELTFSDGKTLVTTDSHPIASMQGWKSISPESTAQENPGLPVAKLEVGDNIYTADGSLCRLTSIQKRDIAPVYNITVDTVHTYYAGGILVHNAKMGAQIGQQASEQIGDIQLPHIDLSGMSAQLGSSFSGIQLPHMDMSGISANLGSLYSGITIPSPPDIGGMVNGAMTSMFGSITVPSPPDIGGMVNGAMTSMFGSITVPSPPDIGGMINGAMTSMFGSITVPSPPDVGGMISGAMTSMFGGVEVPSPPDVGAMISGAMTGMFGGITVPSPPDVGAMINGAMSGMFGGISIPSVPFFAEGVSNFSGGGAVIGEKGTEVVGYNGQYALFDQGATFVNLPSGASVYPLQDMNTYSTPRMLADGTGSGGFMPISISGGGSMPQSLNLHLQIGDMIASQFGIPLARDMRLVAGYRSY